MNLIKKLSSARAIAVLYVIGLSWGLSGAQPFAYGAAQDPMQVCQADIQKHCANIQPGEGRLASCVRENRSKLSTQCKKIVAQKNTVRRERRIACEQDVAKLCSGIQPGGKRVTECLRQQKEKLSKSCRGSKTW